MFKTTKDFKSERVSMIVFGQSGSGKTTLATTLPGRPLIINAENGLLSVSTGKDVPVYDVTVDKNGNPLPRDLRFEKLLHFLKNVLPGMVEKFDWIVIDSLTEVSQNLVEALKKKYPDKSDALKMWGEYNDMMTAFIKEMRDYRPFSVLFLALDSVDKDENGRRFINIDVNGKISSRIPALMDEVFYLKEFEDEKGVKIRKVITSTYMNINAKDRSGTLSQFEDPDLSKIVAKIHGPKKATK